MVSAEYVRAWISIAFGSLLRGIAFSEQTDHAELVAATQQRIQSIESSSAEPLWGLHFSEGKLGLLYNGDYSREEYLGAGTIRVGQGDEWMRYWQWLSEPLGMTQAHSVVQLTAKLLRSRALLHGLLGLLESDDRRVQHLSLAWNSGLFAIDATYVPTWETNTGMIWGLFAATPLLVMVNSPGYAESLWCQREAEMIRYLEQQ